MNSTIVGLIAAIAVLSGGLGFSMTGVFDDQNLMTTRIPGAGFLMGQVEIEARNTDGELFAYRLSDNEVVYDGEQCILKMLFASNGAFGRGEYVTDHTVGNAACTGALTGAWNVIAIGDQNDTGNYELSVLGSPVTLALQDTLTKLGNETGTSCGVGCIHSLARGVATDITWQNGTAGTATKITLAKTFTLVGTDAWAIGESGLFNSTTVDANGMLARQTFTDVSLSNGDSITVTWTFTVGN